jgi:hypothetical protein
VQLIGPRDPLEPRSITGNARCRAPSGRACGQGSSSWIASAPTAVGVGLWPYPRTWSYLLNATEKSLRRDKLVRQAANYVVDANPAGHVARVKGLHSAQS